MTFFDFFFGDFNDRWEEEPIFKSKIMWCENHSFSKIKLNIHDCFKKHQNKHFIVSLRIWKSPYSLTDTFKLLIFVQVKFWDDWINFKKKMQAFPMIYHSTLYSISNFRAKNIALQNKIEVFLEFFSLFRFHWPIQPCI